MLELLRTSPLRPPLPVRSTPSDRCPCRGQRCFFPLKGGDVGVSPYITPSTPSARPFDPLCPLPLSGSTVLLPPKGWRCWSFHVHRCKIRQAPARRHRHRRPDALSDMDRNARRIHHRRAYGLIHPWVQPGKTCSRPGLNLSKRRCQGSLPGPNLPTCRCQELGPGPDLPT